MANMLDYLAWRGDLSLADSPINEVDALILAELSYLNLDGILTAEPGPQLSLRRAAERYAARGNTQPPVINDPRPLMKAAAASRRFGGMKLGGYINLVDPERQLQLAALSLFPEDGSVCAAFRGTDNTIVGWREDFNFCYQEHTAGQAEAVAYLNRLAASTVGPIRVCGHSKGGNFAVYAAAFCDPAVRDERICRVYAEDAPGFRRELAEAPEIRAVLAKTEVFIPESSLIVILLNTKKEKQIVRSDAGGLYQHNPFSWQVLGPRFEAADSRSVSSLLMDETLNRWMDSLSDKERANFVQAVFGAMEKSGALTLHEMKLDPVATAAAILGAVRQMDPELQKSAFATIGKLAAAGGGTLRDELARLLRLRLPDSGQ